MKSTLTSSRCDFVAVLHHITLLLPESSYFVEKDTLIKYNEQVTNAVFFSFDSLTDVKLPQYIPKMYVIAFAQDICIVARSAGK